MRINSLKAMFVSVFILFCLLLLATYTQLFLKLDWHNLYELLLSEEVLFSIRFSLGTSLTALFLAILISIPTAYVLARYPFPGKKVVESIFYLPVFLPPLVSGLALLLLFSSSGGLWLAEQGWDFIFSFRGVIIAQFFVAAPYAVRSFQTAFQTVDRSIEEAAETFGDSPAEVFLKVTLPLSATGLTAGSLLAWARALGEFGATIMLAGATRMQTETLPTSIYLNMTLGDLDSAVAVAVIMLVIAMVLVLCLQFILLRKQRINLFQ
ncbi:MAG: ABC transporter permease [Bacillota bacterium]